ncbi:hypothetical protein [Thermanaerovibrio acidaminovorans]|uniref:hypothetical protein n=1 Tax=Thermanaerovibrio acidaminovorans TaxID=81462 RepID=UPI0024923D2F|nr:hypothetical protein [Thermanaerovibrio acidaminovorans]
MRGTLDWALEALGRIFLGRVRVRSGLRSRMGRVLGGLPHRELRVIRRALEARFISASFVRWRSVRVASASRWVLDPRSVRVSGGLSLPEGRVLGFRVREKEPWVGTVPLGRCPAVLEGLGLVASLPQERSNRIRYAPMELKGASAIALFYPIMRDIVKRSVLDKRSGRLLLWYHGAQSGGKPARLLMVRVFGAEDPIRWVWL